MPLYSTVAEAIARVGTDFPNNGFTFQDLKGVETRYSFAELEVDTARRAAAIQAHGLRKGDCAGIIVIEPEDFILTFLACLRIGVLPAPLYPPMSFGSLDAYAERTATILTNADARLLIASSKLQNILWSMVDTVPSLTRFVRVEDLANSSDLTPDYPEITPDDLAFLQYTSGSTSDPKGVMVTHGGLIANTHAICNVALGMKPEETAVSWLPLYHDMGLIGFVLAPICQGINSVFIPTLRFIKRPSVWLETIHRHRGVATFAPNFAYALTARRVRQKQLDEWDLSCLRVMGCGAEPIQPETMRHFVNTFKPTGLNDNVIMAAYGMAEATLAIALTPWHEHFVTNWVDADTFEAEGLVAEPVEGRHAIEHVGCGTAFPGHEVAVFDDAGNRLPDGHEGELCMRGPSNCPGYFRNPEATAKAFRDGWMHSGDLGYVKNGQVFITGRLKDLIILNGRNIHPQSIEWEAAELPGVRKGNVIAFSVPGASSEEIVLCAETRAKEGRDELADTLRVHIQKTLSLAVSDVVLLEAGSLPKTSSGKLQRRKCRQMYRLGTLGVEGNRTQGAKGNTSTVVRHVARSVWSRAKAALRS